MLQLCSVYKSAENYFFKTKEVNPLIVSVLAKQNQPSSRASSGDTEERKRQVTVLGLLSE